MRIRCYPIDQYSSLRECAADTVNKIEDDAEFCEAEFDLFREWYNEKRFTDEDWNYVLACGYEIDQFQDWFDSYYGYPLS